MKAVGESREIAHLPYKKKTYEDYVGVYGLRGLGRGEWRKNVGTDRHHLPDQDPGRRL